MSLRSGREIRVGLLVLLAFAALAGLFALASGGPGFLTHRRLIDVDFRDGQGIRPGSPVRIAGIDAGRVMAVTLAEVEGVLRARVRLAIPDDLANRLKADARITVQSTLTGQARINIISTGVAQDRLTPGKILAGVETTMFDPILEQVGMGPVERSNISHSIGVARETIDAASPRIKAIVASLDETTAGLRDTGQAVRPVIEQAVGRVDEAAKRLTSSAPKVEVILGQVVNLTARVDALLAENRPNIKDSIASLKDLSANLKELAARDGEKVGVLLDHLDGTRNRADVALFNVKQITDTVVSLLTKNRIEVERTVANVKDMSDWGSKLVQKIYANPFVLSPLYKPTPEDVRVQSVYDSAQIFASAAEKLQDAAKTLAVMQSKPNTPEQREEIDAVRRQVAEVTGRLGQMSTQLTDAMRPQQAARARRGGGQLTVSRFLTGSREFPGNKFNERGRTVR